MKKNKAMSMFVFVALIGIFFTGCEASGNVTETVQETQINDDTSNDNVEDDQLAMDISKEISDIYTVSIDGIVYSLPCHVSDFIDNGWELSEQDENYVVDEIGVDTLWIHKKRDDQLIRLGLGVYSVEKGTAVKELQVGKISVNEGQGVDIDLSGIKIGSSNELVKEFAEPLAVRASETVDTNGRICIKYHFSDEEKIKLVEDGTESIEFVLDPDTENVFLIIMQFYPAI